MSLLLQVNSLSKSLPSQRPGGDSLSVVADFSLAVNEGELVTLFGPNGSGKTTILNLLSGLISPDKGDIVWHEGGTRSIAVGYVFQDYHDTLLPWCNVEANVAFPLQIRGDTWQNIKDQTHRVLDQLHLLEHAHKYIYELSGGLKQLVSIARSTVYKPRLLLLDEPFSALDYSTARTMWLKFRDFCSDAGVTAIFVSHNVDEAVFLGDRVAVVSSRPARVVADIHVPFGSKRTTDLLERQDFFEIRSKVLRAFQDGNSK